MFSKTVGEILNRINYNKSEIHQIIEFINHSEPHHIVETMNHSELSDEGFEIPANIPHHSSSSESSAHLISNITTQNDELIITESVAMINESVVDVIQPEKFDREILSIVLFVLMVAILLIPYLIVLLVFWISRTESGKCSHPESYIFVSKEQSGSIQSIHVERL